MTIRLNTTLLLMFESTYMFRLAKVAFIRLKKIKSITDSIKPLNAAVNFYFYFIHGQPDDGSFN